MRGWVFAPANALKTFAFQKFSPKTFTPFDSAALDFLLLRHLSSLHPVPVKGRFRERHEAVRAATGPSRLSKPFAWRREERHTCKDLRVTCGSRGRTAQGPSNATGSHSVKTPAGVALGVCKPLIRRVRSAGVKATVHRCDSLLVCANAHQAAGSHNAQAFRTPFRAF